MPEQALANIAAAAAAATATAAPHRLRPASARATSVRFEVELRVAQGLLGVAGAARGRAPQLTQVGSEEFAVRQIAQVAAHLLVAAAAQVADAVDLGHRPAAVERIDEHGPRAVQADQEVLRHAD